MLILGIDPGSRKTGYAVIESHGARFKRLTSGVFHFEKVDSFYERLGVMREAFTKVKEDYRPHQVAIEALVFIKNPRSLIKLAQARGAMLSALHDLPVREYSPNEIKKTISGYGLSQKLGMQKALKIFMKDDDLKFESDDESDALAIAMTQHFFSQAPRRSSHDRFC